MNHFYNCFYSNYYYLNYYCYNDCCCYCTNQIINDKNIINSDNSNTKNEIKQNMTSPNLSSAQKISVSDIRLNNDLQLSNLINNRKDLEQELAIIQIQGRNLTKEELDRLEEIRKMLAEMDKL